MALRARWKQHASRISELSPLSHVASGTGPSAATARPQASRREILWWIWAFPLAFVVHDGEEALSIVLQGGYREGEQTASLSVTQALAGIGFELTAVVVLALLVSYGRWPGWLFGVYVGVIAGWTLHGVGHLLAGAAAPSYVMGVVTALPACVAHGSLTLARFYRAGLLGGRRLIGSGVLGVFISVMAVELAHVYGRLVS